MYGEEDYNGVNWDELLKQFNSTEGTQQPVDSGAMYSAIAGDTAEQPAPDLATSGQTTDSVPEKIDEVSVATAENPEAASAGAGGQWPAGTMQTKGMSDLKKTMLALSSILGRLGSASMGKSQTGKEFGNTIASIAEGQLYNEAKRKMLASILGGGGSSSPFQSSSIAMPDDLGVIGLNPGQIDRLYDTGYAEMSKERGYPMEVAKTLGELGLRDAQAEHTREQTKLMPETSKVSNYLHQTSAEHNVEVTKAVKQRREEEARETQAFNDYLVQADLNKELPFGMDEATFKLAKEVGGKAGMNVVKEWSMFERANNKPITTIEELVVNKLMKGEKPSDDLIKFMQMKRGGAAGTPANMKGTMINDKNNRIAVRSSQLLQPFYSKNQKAMQELQQEMKPDAYGNVSFAPVMSRLMNLPDSPGKTEAIRKIRAAEKLYTDAPSYGLPPSAVEDAVDDIFAGREPKLPKEMMSPGAGGSQPREINGNFDTRQLSPKVREYSGLITQFSTMAGLDPSLVARVVGAESNGNKSAESAKGAGGLMQLMPDTAKQMGLKPGDIGNPHKNIWAGTQYLAIQKKRYGSDVKALIAYNWGPERIANGVTRVPTESVNFVNKVLGGNFGRDSATGKMFYIHQDGRREAL